MRNGLNQPGAIQNVGFVALILASASHWFFRSGRGMPEAVRDASTGLLYGIAIGALLMSVWKRARARRER
ncbi:MAG: hypothetical protein IT348_19660 [Candidatus Eisenbacteria bacterium]|nr:hypothetical protein [Candidatus Eisenbacteria bacterium]